MSKFKMDCGKCNTDLRPEEGIGEYYMLRDDVWDEANGSPHGFLCLSCVEDGIARPLEAKDFIDCPLNDLRFPIQRSDYLTSLLTDPARSPRKGLVTA